MKNLIAGVAILMVFAASAASETNGDKLEAFTSKLPRSQWGGSMYWLEMQSIIGWEKVMLVFGYAANGPVCERLAAVAKIDAPQRDFRCKAAN